MTSQPNIVIMLSDQHNAKVLGCKNDPNVKTPNLDRMAAEGVRFDNCIAQNPVCTPSRVSWMSGQYCHNHGYYGLCGPRPRGLPTILGHFRKAGYKTGYIGKPHFPEYWVEDDCDVFLPVNCAIGGAPEFQAYKKKHWTWKGDIPPARGRFKNEQPLDGFADTTPFIHSGEGWSVQKAKEFIAGARAENKPFILFVGFQKPHQNYSPAEEFWNLYSEDKLVMPPNADYEMEGKAPNLKNIVKEFREAEWVRFEPRTYEAGRIRKLRGYLGNVSQVDHAVGKILDILKEENLEENTICAYSSDHGDFACEHGAIEKAPGICSDAITRVPFIWRWPGKIKAGHVANQIVETVDLANTLCSLCGLEEMETSDGGKLNNLLNGEDEELHTMGVTEFNWSKSIRWKNMRLVYYPKDMFAEEYPDGFGELYDLENDPWEMNNLYFDPAYQQTIDTIKSIFLDWLIQTSRAATTMVIKPYAGAQSTTRYHHTINADGKVSWKLLADKAGANYL